VENSSNQEKKICPPCYGSLRYSNLLKIGKIGSKNQTMMYKSITQILDNRNVWIVNPRNFGDSDHHDSFDLEEVSNDVLRWCKGCLCIW
jgi:hypothetical protein